MISVRKQSACYKPPPYNISIPLKANQHQLMDEPLNDREMIETNRTMQ